MNTIGIIVSVALPAFACGVSVAAWIIRSAWQECDCCGDITDRGVFRCTGCDGRSFEAAVEHAAALAARR